MGPRAARRLPRRALSLHPTAAPEPRDTRGGRSPRPGSILSRPIQPSGRGPAGAGLGVAAGGIFLTPQRLRGSNLRAPLAASTQRGGAGAPRGRGIGNDELRRSPGEAPEMLPTAHGEAGLQIGAARTPGAQPAPEGNEGTPNKFGRRGLWHDSAAPQDHRSNLSLARRARAPSYPRVRAQDLTRGAALDRRRSEPRGQTPDCEAPPVPPGPRRSQGSPPVTPFTRIPPPARRRWPVRN